MRFEVFRFKFVTREILCKVLVTRETKLGPPHPSLFDFLLQNITRDSITCGEEIQRTLTEERYCCKSGFLLLVTLWNQKSCSVEFN